MPSIEDTKTLAEAAAFVRRERQLRGWTAKDFADRLSEVAASIGDELNLTQQAISFFETGKAKSFPRWLRHANLVFAEDDVSRRVAAEEAEPDDDFDADVPDSPVFNDEEVGLVEAFRELERAEQLAILTLAHANRAKARSPTVHDKGVAFKGHEAPA